MRRTVTILNPKQTKLVFLFVLFDKKSYTIVFNYSRNMLSSQLPISNVQMRNVDFSLSMTILITDHTRKKTSNKRKTHQRGIWKENMTSRRSIKDSSRWPNKTNRLTFIFLANRIKIQVKRIDWKIIPKRCKNWESEIKKSILIHKIGVELIILFLPRARQGEKKNIIIIAFYVLLFFKRDLKNNAYYVYVIEMYARRSSIFFFAVITKLLKEWETLHNVWYD